MARISDGAGNAIWILSYRTNWGQFLFDAPTGAALGSGLASGDGAEDGLRGGSVVGGSKQLSGWRA